MATYARLQDGVVAELFTTAGDVTKLFPRAMVWLDVSATPDAAVGWIAHGGVVRPPAVAFAPAASVPIVPTPAVVTLATVQAELTALQAQVTQLIAAGAKA